MKAYTDIKQSITLMDTLPVETSDSHYARKVYDDMGNPIDGKWLYPKYGNPNSRYAQYVMRRLSAYQIIPCWSLTALLSVLPNPILTQFSEDKWNIAVFDNDNHFKEDCFADEPIDACYEMVIKLHKKNLLKK